MTGSFLRNSIIIGLVAVFVTLTTGCGSKEAKVVRLLTKWAGAVQVYPERFGNSNIYEITPITDFECEGSNYAMTTLEGEQYAATLQPESTNSTVPPSMVINENYEFKIVDFSTYFNASGGLLGRSTEIDDLKYLEIIGSGFVVKYDPSTNFIVSFKPDENVQIEKATYDGEDLDIDKLIEAFNDEKNNCM